jgi:valyl-tRNA synthetase
MAKNKFDFKKSEQKWMSYWEEKNIYEADLKNKKIYSIDTPPPTVSGEMHIGHAFSYAQQDFIARFNRMFTGSVYYPFGTDDNGLPTERLVEKINKVKSKNMTRAEFIALCQKTLKEITPKFTQDWKNLGISCDYKKTYSTIDKKTQKLSQKYFLNLLKKEIVYKKQFPTIWCPECQTSIAQAELEDKEAKTLFSTLKFKVENKNLLIATTRPELLGACVAIFVNPKDKRYKKLVGKYATVPIFGNKVPIIEDNSAEIDKGTGVLMICSYGDKFDVDAINRHKLTPKIILDKDGTLNTKKYNKLKIKDARKKILEDLKEKNLIAEQKEIEHILNTHDKCNTPIEFITTEQWFIKLLDKKKKLIAQGNKINWYPRYMKKRYENWTNGLEWDWSISRERHFGIPIPIWECKKCKKIITPEDKELPIDPLSTKKICKECKEPATPEDKVLDTWITSSISPQIASGLIDNKITTPLSLRPQAHDIIRTWAFYTIAQSYMHENKIPWQDIVISGNVSLGGEKMSKSKGNVIDPKKVMEEYGSDALRFWASGSKLGSDLDYQEKDLIAGKKFVNKLLNASRFVFMNLEDYNGGKRPKKLEQMDKIFLERLNEMIKDVTKDFEKYEYSKSKSRAEQFFWNDFCDNYLEIVKKRVYQGKGDRKLSAQYTLYQTLLTLIKIFSPITPFITEEIYQEHFKKFEKDKSIHTSSWPEHKNTKYEDTIFETFIETLSKIRQEKSNKKKAMNAEITLTLEKTTIKKLEKTTEDLKSVTNATEIKTGKFKIEFKE